MINMLLLGLSKIWNWQITNISATIIVIAGVISLYLVSGKLFELEEIIPEEEKTVDKEEE